MSSTKRYVPNWAVFLGKLADSSAQINFSHILQFQIFYAAYGYWVELDGILTPINNLLDRALEIQIFDVF